MLPPLPCGVGTEAASDPPIPIIIIFQHVEYKNVSQFWKVLQKCIIRLFIGAFL